MAYSMWVQTKQNNKQRYTGLPIKQQNQVRKSKTKEQEEQEEHQRKHKIRSNNDCRE